MPDATSKLPREKLTFFRINARVAKTWAVCDSCKKVMTKGRDGFGCGQCDACLVEILEQSKHFIQTPEEHELNA